MSKTMIHPAEDYLVQHELDIKDSIDLRCNGIVEKEIPPEIVRAIRNSLNLNLEMFALLLGINLTAMLRYESISVPPYPQGNVSRKLCLLSGWMADPKSAADIHTLLSNESGLATLSGLLQSESVNSFLRLAKLHEQSISGHNDAFRMFQDGPGRA
jgi:DNA-binding transcriptional regulator YiaG